MVKRLSSGRSKDSLYFTHNIGGRLRIKFSDQRRFSEHLGDITLLPPSRPGG